MPLAYSGFTKTAQNLRMSPPEKLNMDAYWPVTRDVGSVADSPEADDAEERKEVAAKG